MYPNYKDRDVNREDAEHQDEDGMGVVIEIIMCPRTLFQSKSLVSLSAGLCIKKLTSVSRANLNARVQVASCTMQASK